MNDNSMNESEATLADAKLHSGTSDVELVDFLIMLARHKKRIILFPLVAAIAAAAVSMVLPATYRARTKLLPPQQAQSGAAALLSQLGGVAGAAAGVAGIKNPNDLYVAMLKSRTVADRLIAQFDLKKRYGTESQDEARLALEANTFISAGKDGLITIEVEDKQQNSVAPMANSYVDILAKLTRELAVTEASQRRLFYERQLEQSKNNLAKAEMRLKNALETHGVISVDADSRAIVETVGRLRAQISAKEIQLNSLRSFVTPNNPEFKRVEEELNSARGELAKLENGRLGAGNAPAGDGNPQPGLENIKTLRDVKYNQMLYELLAKQYEIARLDEAKEAGVIQVLDSAVDPERRFKPKRTVIVLLSALTALLAAVLSAFVSQAKANILQSPERAMKWSVLKSKIRFGW